MAKVQKFEELKIWQVARQIARQVYALLYELLTSESRMISRFQASLRQSQVKGRYYKDSQPET